MTLAATTGGDAIAQYLEAFEAREARSEPKEIATWRRAALARLRKRGFPSPRDEAWRQTDPRPFSRAFKPALLASTDAPPPPAPPSQGAVLLVNGCRVAGDPPAEWQDHVGFRPPANHDAIADEGASAFALLSVAFFPELTAITVPAGTVLSAPLRWDHIAQTPPSAPSTVFPRIHISLGERAEATLVETYASHGGGDALTNAHTQVTLARGAQLTHVRHQREGASALHLGRLVVRQERESTFTSHVVSTGARMSRLDVDITFRGDGCDANLSGLFAGVDHQHIDTHTRVDHATPHGTSRQVYKGILGGHARGVFHGRVLVRADAQKTDARQTNKNLLLSDDAHVDSTPQLEIRADDVRCTHGSTIGQLDEDALFYLRSRGLDVPEATRLLVHAFAHDVVGTIPDARVVDAANRFIERALVDARIPVASP